MTADLATGTELAGYTIDRVVGRGGMGVVHRARQHMPERWVALKVINPTFAHDLSFRRRFERETAAAVAIDHPHILPVYDAGEAGGVLFIAMRFVEGEELGEILGAGPLDPARVASIAGQLGAALDAAHARGLVHRDVKPGNVLVVHDAAANEPDFCYLTDFGVSMWTTSADRTLTAEGQIVGSLQYVAPEQILGEAVDGAADLYSLGCVIYECLTGRPPFTDRSPAGTLHAHLNESPPRPSSVRTGLPAGVDAVVARALAKRPEDRFASGRELAAALRQALTGDGTIDVPVTTRRHRFGRWLAAVAGLVLVMAAVTGAVMLVSGRDEPNGPPASPPPLIRAGVQVTATSTAPSSTDASGNVVTYAPANVIDGAFDTAWRTPGDGAGQAVTLVFDTPIDVVRIGLVPGYAKTDPGTGVDRFGQNRIITQVRYLAPGLEPVTQTFRPEPVPQFVRLDATTRRIRIEILATTLPGGGPTFDYTAVSEVYVYGYEQ